MLNLYLIVKSLHIISFTAWMAGMFYLPRLFVYHSEKNLREKEKKRFLLMEKRLLKIIMNPSMILTWLFGIILTIQNPFYLTEIWFHIKILFVFLMSGMHGYFSYCYKMFLYERNNKSHKFFRIINEVPTIFFLIIVFVIVFGVNS